MQQPRNFPKVASDLFMVQGIWASGYLGIMLVVQIVKIILSLLSNNEVATFFDTTFIASNIFMLVIGIISVSGFLPHYVGQGVTRRDYFKGTILGAIGLALAISIVSAAVTGIFHVLTKLLKLQMDMTSLENVHIDEGGNVVGMFVKSVILTPHVELSSNWLLATLVFASNIFIYYVIGWLIGAAFSRLGAGKGILLMIAGILAIHAADILLSLSLGLEVPSFVAHFEMPFFVPLITLFLLIVACLWVIRLLTKRIIVKF